MGNIKITSKLSPPYRLEKEKGDGFCKLCGVRLTSEQSRKRGYGHKCINKIPVMIILEIPGPEERGGL